MLNLNYIGTEHFLSGLMLKGEGIAAQATELLSGYGGKVPATSATGRARFRIVFVDRSNGSWIHCCQPRCTW